MSINGQGHSLTLVKGHSDFKVKCLTFGLYTQVSDSGPLGPLVSNVSAIITETQHLFKSFYVEFDACSLFAGYHIGCK